MARNTYSSNYTDSHIVERIPDDTLIILAELHAVKVALIWISRQPFHESDNVLGLYGNTNYHLHSQFPNLSGNHHRN